MSLGVATSLTSKFFETMLSTPAWISFRRCNPHAPGGATRTAPPFSLAAPAVLSARARTMPRMRPTLPCRQAFLSSFGTAPRRCSDGVLHASDVASPARVSRPWWWAHSGAAAIVQSGRVHVSIAILASDGGLKLLVELPYSASLLLPSLLSALSVITAFHAHVVAVLPANISGLSRGRDIRDFNHHC